jgi:hypothetical protein
MTISYPRSLPSEMIIEQAEFKTRSLVGMTTGFLSGVQQVHAFPGQWWEADVVVAPSNEPEGRAIAAWLTSLNGSEKTVLFGDPACATPQGGAATTPGTPLVNGASQTGSALIIDGAGAGQTPYLSAGDYIQLGSGSTSRLHMVLEDANSDGSGNVTVSLWPNLRAAPADDAAVVVSDAKGLFRLSDNNVSWSLRTVIWGFRFSLREAL